MKGRPSTKLYGQVLTECYCPCCEKTHKIKLYWTGRYKPRKFCHCCKEVNKGVDDKRFSLSSREVIVASVRKRMKEYEEA